MSTSVSTGGLGCWAGPGLLPLPLLLLAPPSAVGCLGIPPAARAQLRHQLSTARNFLPSAAELDPTREPSSFKLYGGCAERCVACGLK